MIMLLFGKAIELIMLIRTMKVISIYLLAENYMEEMRI